MTVPLRDRAIVLSVSESQTPLPRTDRMTDRSRIGRGAGFVIAMAAAVLATALSWSGVSLRELLTTLFSPNH